MLVLVIDDVVRGNAERVIKYAQANVVTRERLVASVGHPENAIGNDASFRLVIPMGYRCVFSLEEQPTLGVCRHLSVSIPDAGRMPNPYAMAEIMELFGFSQHFVELIRTIEQEPPRELQDKVRGRASFWVETLDIPPQHAAINALEVARDGRAD